MALRAGPSERVAGLAFLAFTLMQVPYLAMRNTTITGWPSVMALSPLQITAAKIAAGAPGAEPALEALLLPGTWLRECLSPLLRCKLETSGGACERETRLLSDWARVRRRVQLPSLVKLVEGRDFARGGEALVYGSALISLSAALSAVVTVKSAALGFVLLGFGAIQGGHQLLPPGLLTAVLCVYAGFNLGEGRGALRREPVRRRQQPRQAAGRDAAGGGGGGSGGQAAGATAGATPAKGAKGQAKAKARRA
ncbi:hypothetical protein Rsub_11772 [Raphidocelis subcapitata]|uniref:Uncharacterized protein n=1 Tax=Raphidocelis subcapitata TaxID=307507 RepID=A0A2V0PP65_9CHLO|nr:hypothetical protein Rsub_11772 [Raphidocelis subcapitata]|eukprot:GBF99247.1 hypothetical protein Rsub_11772 [Raphidocelis subcapitata]